MTSPRLAISCGDPSGIGPEITVAAVAALGDAVTALWLGEPDHLPQSANPEVISAPDQARPGALNVLPVGFAPEAVVPGQPALAHAAGTIDAIRRGTELVASGAADALVTAPITKKVLVDGAGFAFPGHTEFLAHLAGVDRVAMMLVGGGLRAVPVTIHMPLRDVPGALTTEAISETARITAQGLRQHFGIDAPRLVVAGLNPHAGEGGLMGTEDDAIIAPAVAALQAEGLAITGPHPADTLFHASARARYDAAIAMYHDQALIPVKTLGFDAGVNVTLGLPYLRTSPDHGTAHDIAGKGLADPGAMIAAMRVAAGM